MNRITIDKFGSFHAEVGAGGAIKYRLHEVTFNGNGGDGSFEDCLIAACQYLLDDAVAYKQHRLKDQPPEFYFENF